MHEYYMAIEIAYFNGVTIFMWREIIHVPAPPYDLGFTGDNILIEDSDDDKLLLSSNSEGPGWLNELGRWI